MTEKRKMQTKPRTYLHPKEEPLGPRLELEHVHPPAGALRHALELTVVGEDDQVLPRATEEERVRCTETHTADPTASRGDTPAPTDVCVGAGRGGAGCRDKSPGPSPAGSLPDGEARVRGTPPRA